MLSNIVFGFFMESFVGVEQESSYTVMAGWQKGSALVGRDLILDVISIGITASGFSFFLVATVVH